jgi:ATP-binding cassette subfamily C protein LapB
VLAARRSADRYRPALGVEVAAASILVNALGLALPIVLLQVYDRIIPRAAVESLALLIAGLGVALLFEIALRLSRAALLHWVGARFEHELSMAAIDHALRCDIAALEREAPGAHLERMAGIAALRTHRAGEAALARYDLGFAALFLCAIAWISPLVAGALLAMALLALAIGERQGRRIRDCSAARQAHDGERWSFVIEALGAMEVVKSLGVEGAMERRYDRLCRGSAALGRDLADASGFAAGLNSPLLQGATLIVAAVGALEVVADQMTVGGLAACVLLSNRLMQPILGLQAQRNRGRLAAHSAARLDGLFALPADAERDRQPGLIRSLELRGAGCDRDDGWPILQEVSLRVETGETVAITGPNGSGKSTLMWMLSGDLKPQRGALLINGDDAASLSHEALQAQIGFLTQQSAMLDGTVLDNLTRFEPERHLDAAMQLCRQFGLDRWFAERPEGFNARVGGGTRSLPPAIEQQIAFVRALVLRPRVILFDEACAALDPAAEARLRAYLVSRKGDAAIVLATRQSRYLALADRRYRIARYGLEADDAAQSAEGAA